MSTGTTPQPSLAPEPSVERAICQFWEDMFDSYGGGSGGPAGMEIERVREGDDVVVILIHGWWRARGDVPLEARWAQTFWLRDAKILRGEAHGQYGTALHAAGLVGGA